MKINDLMTNIEARNSELEVSVRRLTYALDVAIPYLRERVRGEQLTAWDAERLQSDLDTVKAAIEHGVCVLYSR